MSSQEYVNFCHEVHNILLQRLERRETESRRFATRRLAESVLESHYLRLFFRSLAASDPPNAPPFVAIAEDEFVQNTQERHLHGFLAIIVFAGCRIEAAKTFAKRLVAAPVWPPPAGRDSAADVCSLPASRRALTDFFGGDEATADRFFGTQALFCTVVLRQREETTVQDGDTQRLPYIEEELLGSGSFGRVYKVKIARGHIEDRHTDEVSNKEKWVARKDYIVKSQPEDPDVETRVEGNIMKMILSASKTCENILENLGTLNIESPKATYSLFMPLAICDLGAYMKKDGPAAQRDAKSRAGLIRSAMGLATGLRFLHDEMQTPDLERVVCYHMDLKPSNILIFRDANSGSEQGSEPRYIWKLSDFGMSKVKIRHQNRREEERDISSWFRNRREMDQNSLSGTQNRRGQGTYQPPESFPSGKFMNTKSDVWSLGCVLSVFFSYLEHGKDAIADYQTDRLKDRRGIDNGFDGFFYENSFGKFTLHPAIKKTHGQLVNKAGARGTQERKAAQSALTFLEDKVLVIEQNKRCSAKEVEAMLKRTLDAYQKLAMVEIAQTPQDLPEEAARPRNHIYEEVKR